MSDEKLQTRVRREQIAEAALELVAKHGLRRLSVAAVARRVGLVPSGIYRHFKSKDAILDAVLALLGQRLADIVRAACEESAEALPRLRGVITQHVRFIREGRAIPRIIFTDDVPGGSPLRKKQVLAIMQAYMGQVADIIRQGQQEGAIDAQLEPESAAMMLFGIVVPAGILWHLTEGGFDVTRLAERQWRLLVRALAPPAAGSRK